MKSAFFSAFCNRFLDFCFWFFAFFLIFAFFLTDFSFFFNHKYFCVAFFTRPFTITKNNFSKIRLTQKNTQFTKKNSHETRSQNYFFLNIFMLLIFFTKYFSRTAFSVLFFHSNIYFFKTIRFFHFLDDICSQKYLHIVSFYYHKLVFKQQYFFTR